MGRTGSAWLTPPFSAILLLHLQAAHVRNIPPPGGSRGGGGRGGREAGGRGLESGDWLVVGRQGPVAGWWVWQHGAWWHGCTEGNDRFRHTYKYIYIYIYVRERKRASLASQSPIHDEAHGARPSCARSSRSIAYHNIQRVCGCPLGLENVRTYEHNIRLNMLSRDTHIMCTYVCIHI